MKPPEQVVIPAQWNCPYCNYGEYKNRPDWAARANAHLEQCPDRPKDEE